MLYAYLHIPQRLRMWRSLGLSAKWLYETRREMQQITETQGQHTISQPTKYSWAPMMTPCQRLRLAHGKGNQASLFILQERQPPFCTSKGKEESSGTLETHLSGYKPLRAAAAYFIRCKKHSYRLRNWAQSFTCSFIIYLVLIRYYQVYVWISVQPFHIAVCDWIYFV